jgi:hypothetical protein
MGSVWCAGLLIAHLLGIPVVCRNEQDIPRFLCCFVDCSNRLVSFGDGSDGGIVYAGVPDLVIK